MSKEKIDIRWHGRGGQGAITAARVVAKAMFDAGYSGVAMVPTFGTERRGAPVFTSLKISKTKIYDLSPIEEPDIIVVLDHLLLQEEDITYGLKNGGILVINSPCGIEDHRMDGIKVAVCDVTELSKQAGLPEGMVNAGIIGALATASGIIDIESLIDAVKAEFSKRKPDRNAQAARLAYENTIIG
jgi:2-oxoacid:acceptor oxidoreductase gamma subunit (pyruvate/2-ketoisovalerate family)